MARPIPRAAPVTRAVFTKPYPFSKSNYSAATATGCSSSSGGVGSIAIAAMAMPAKTASVMNSSKKSPVLSNTNATNGSYASSDAHVIEVL